MSIIVIRDGVMASDGLMCSGGYWEIHSLAAQKMYRISDGSIVGTVGSTGAARGFCLALDRDPSAGAELARDWLKKETETSCTRLMPDGTVYGYDNTGETKYSRMKFYAWGAGAGVAIGAMEMGASARRACAIAITRNIGARGRVQLMRPRKPTTTAKRK